MDSSGDFVACQHPTEFFRPRSPSTSVNQYAVLKGDDNPTFLIALRPFAPPHLIINLSPAPSTSAPHLHSSYFFRVTHPHCCAFCFCISRPPTRSQCLFPPSRRPPLRLVSLLPLLHLHKLMLCPCRLAPLTLTPPPPRLLLCLSLTLSLRASPSKEYCSRCQHIHS